MENGKSLVVALAVAAIVVFVLPAASSVADEPMVVVSRPGTVFHKAGSGDVRGRGYEKPLAKALEDGYVPCPACFAAEAKASRIDVPAPIFSGIIAKSGGNALAALPSPGSGSTLPFGLRFGRPAVSSLHIDAGRDPYADLNTIWNPGPEQGAYCCICPLCRK